MTSRLILPENYQKFGDKTLTRIKPNYSIFSAGTSHPLYQEAAAKGYTTLITKEELGHEISKGECDSDVLPNRAAYDLTRPAFLVRDPVCVFDSWKRMEWDDLYNFFVCYKSIFRMLNVSPAPKAVIYERLISDPNSTMSDLCKHWNIAFEESCLNFKRPFGDFVFNSDREQSIYQGTVSEGLFDRVKSHSGIEDFAGHGLLSALEIECIEAEVGGLYLKSCGSFLDTIRSSLSSKNWFGFDLDDTLHEFRKASAHASSSVFEAIQEDSGISVHDLKASYGEILCSKTASAFTDGRTSTEYRRERFNLLLLAHKLETPDAKVDHLLEVYKRNLKAALTLKAGALQLLKKIKSLGKKIIVVTEGPQDAQEWTIEELGLQPYVDTLVTTNEAGKSKIYGLFAAVLDKHQILAEDIVYIGDNETRDVLPAQAEGILAILYDEKRNCRFDNSATFRINSLAKLEYLLDQGH